MKSPSFLVSLMLCACGAWPSLAAAQSVCASDGQPHPMRLMERFTNADCGECWRDPSTAKADRGTLALDWVVPGILGDDAPLSAVASRDAAARLGTLGERVPATQSARLRAVQPVAALTPAVLRVARGLALSGYIGASIALKPAPRRVGSATLVTAWLALVETLPAGLEGSPVERNLVRNVFQINWSLRQSLSKTQQNQWFDQRSMSVAEGVNPERLQVIGWLEDVQGRVLVAAQSVCTATP